MSDFGEWPEFRWYERPQWCTHCHADVTMFGHKSDCPDHVEPIAPANVEQRITEAVAAEGEACAIVAEDHYVLDVADFIVSELTQGLSAREMDVYHLGWNDCATSIADAIRARTGEGKRAPMSDKQSCET